ncbi:SDR family oxidoreductase [Synechococcus sp. PCC 6312]|uniref:SDR family oxidoreductase n=1 Tax=Synechococcus sp. (strain ATCC 27167 / PCC 6312) TaxID=195253 RepID=UPI00029F13E3|nr:SDR family oxidoreductase [Synechococcus sp. PCC 6312]AFY62142.1 short-chain dehydrogenase of unknown substrate specificity [Synechococcus sp. PCC 6312]
MDASSAKRKILVVGASRGIGAAVAEYFVQQGDDVVCISRSQSTLGRWIQGDISTATGITSVVAEIGNTPVDALLFMGGTWEQQAFTTQYDFIHSPDAETRYVIAVNTIAPIELTKQLIPNLRQSHHPRAIFMGALSGLDHCATIEVANTASKFGLRGAAQALRIALASENIGITVINPGNIATPEVLEDIAAGRFQAQVPIPIADLISAIAWILSLSAAVDVGEITLYQKG